MMSLKSLPGGGGDDTDVVAGTRNPSARVWFKVEAERRIPRASGQTVQLQQQVNMFSE